MNYEKFGDSYDFVKRGILQLLKGRGGWSVHPMFTDPDPARYAAEYRRLIGVPTVTDQSFVQSGRNRNAWLASARTCRSHLFIDPCTGLPFDKEGLPSHENRLDPAFLKASELAQIARERPDELTLVFDQSFHRKKELPITDQIEQKLDWLEGQRIHGLAYHSHANFVIASMNRDVLLAARHLLEGFNFPEGRLIP